MTESTYDIVAGPYSMDFDYAGGPEAFRHNGVCAEVRLFDDRRNTALFYKENPLPKSSNPRDAQAFIVRESEKRAEAKRGRRRMRKCKTCFTELAPAQAECFYC